MGLLDDAIRQHLDLKKKHGAPAEEVAQQEHEALGPARSAEASEAPAAEPEPPAPAAEEVPPAAVEPVEEPWLDEPDEVPAGEALDHGTTSQPTAEFIPEDVEDEEPVAAEPPAPEPEFVAPDEEPGADDVLEETPDFLQETPEHDRLWFEQKPPKDFDFDK
jgi:hypothetical protein